MLVTVVTGDNVGGDDVDGVCVMQPDVTMNAIKIEHKKKYVQFLITPMAG
jgi:hypothetical protein